jgi:hypothetical protein
MWLNELEELKKMLFNVNMATKTKANPKENVKKTTISITNTKKVVKNVDAK